MSFVLFWLLILLIFISVLGGIIFLRYWIPKRLGKKKLGKWIASIIALALLLFMFRIVFPGYFYFKSDAVKELSQYNFKLEDNFQIMSNSEDIFPKSCRVFELSISQNDKQRLQDQITKANDFQGDWEDYDIEKDRPRYSDEDITYTARYAAYDSYIFESFHPNKSGYTPTHIMMLISQSRNTLTFKELWY